MTPLVDARRQSAASLAQSRYEPSSGRGGKRNGGSRVQAAGYQTFALFTGEEQVIRSGSPVLELLRSMALALSVT